MHLQIFDASVVLLLLRGLTQPEALFLRGLGQVLPELGDLLQLGLDLVGLVVSGLDQLFAGLDDLVEPLLVGLELHFEVVVLLDFAVQVGGVEVGVVGGDLQLLVDPPLRLVAVAVEVLSIEVRSGQ